MPDHNEDLDSRPVFERRRFVRVGRTFVVSYREASAKDLKTDITQTMNISAGGLMFTTDRQFSSGSTLILKLRVPGTQNYIDIKVKVVDSKKRSSFKSGICETRVQFTGISEKDKDLIGKAIETHFKR
ncbi:MAG: PilZ domain-containing protein [Candidatus Omnitrophica bacterium]|nr:PilZ domain-containing protein [Candidatus Omnitrophota bacterium]